jgi:two-component system, OmpR family, alkaline phosphatase synthesis response regulator PhoP
MEHLLLVEDEEALRVQLCRALTFHGYSVEAVADGGPALAAHEARRADLIILDLMLPGMDGFQVIHELRNKGDVVPILMLTARASESDRVKGLSLGCDDYLVKPFSLLELMARIRAILRRIGMPAPSVRSYNTGALTLDLQSYRATMKGAVLDLTSREFRILEILVSRAGSTLSREEVLFLAWPTDGRPSVRTVDTHIKNLRKKLGDDERNLLTTVGGEGYRWGLPTTANP